MREPTIWFRGSLVGLGPCERDLAGEYWRWESDPGAIRGFGKQIPETLESRTAGLEVQLANSAHPRFTVYQLDTGKPVGLVSFTIDDPVRTAEYTLVMAPEVRGKGLGTEATILALDYAFHLTNLRTVWLKVLEPNTAAIHAYEKAGFAHAGRIRQAGYWYGQPCNELIMDTVIDDFVAPSVVVGH